MEWFTDVRRHDFVREQDLLVKLTRDMKNAASTLKKPEVRFLVEAYYRMQEQENRVRTSDAYHEGVR